MPKVFTIKIESNEQGKDREIDYFFDTYPIGTCGFSTCGFSVGFSKVFTYNNRDKCIQDMIQNAKNQLLRHYGLPEED